jgi:uncharacterized membrane protein YjdF
MVRVNRHLEISLVAFMFLFGCAFLLKMCYLSLALNTVFVVLFLATFYLYLRLRHQIPMPPLLLLFVFLAVQVDALGNFFRMYGQRFGPMQYDQFSHMTVQLLITPIIIWLLHGLLRKLEYSFSLRLASCFGAIIMFSLASFYEIIELWDELYFGGQRIWGPYDTAMDLQWDLCGIIVGTLVANLALKKAPQITQVSHPEPEMI